MIILEDYPRIHTDIKSKVANSDFLIQINTNPTLYIGTRKQSLGDDLFFEDKDLKISGLTEKIDIKDKKIQFSKVKITLNNFKVNNLRLSDSLSSSIGTIVHIYLKTQSCKVITDCVKLCELKILKVTHDSSKLKIDCEDVAQEVFYPDLPIPFNESPLQEGINTFEHYNLN